MDIEYRRRARDRNAIRSAFTAAIARASSVLAAFVTVPITLEYLGRERYGLYIASSILVGWLVMLDFGLGLSLRNLVAYAHGREDPGLVRQNLSTATALSVISVVPILGVAWIASPRINWSAVLNAGTNASTVELTALVRAIACVVAASIITKLILETVRALQRGPLINYMYIASAVLSIFSVLAAVHLRASLAKLALALALPDIMASLVLWVVLAVRDQRFQIGLAHVRLKNASTLLKAGGAFSLIALADLGIYQTDAILISHFCGPGEVTPFSVAARITGVGWNVLAAYLSAIWPAYAEAAVRSDWHWVRRAHSRTRLWITAVTAIGGMLLVLLGPILIPWWAGPGARGTRSLYAAIALQTILSAWTRSHSVLLAGANVLAYQVGAGLLQALIGIAASVMLLKPFGAVGVVLGNCVGYLVISSWFFPLAAKRILESGSFGQGS